MWTNAKLFYSLNSVSITTNGLIMQQLTFLFLLKFHRLRCYELLAYWQPFDFCHFNFVQFNELSPTSAELYNYYARINTRLPHLVA